MKVPLIKSKEVEVKIAESSFLFLLTILALILLVPVSFISCSGKRGEGTKDNKITQDNFCEIYIEKLNEFKEKLRECGLSKGGETENQPQECSPRIKELLNLVKEGKINFKQDTAEQYIEEIEKTLSLDCQSFLNKSRTNIGKINKLMKYLVSSKVFSGIKKEGEECAFHQECVEGFFCSDTCPGKCIRAKQEGESCSDTELCAEGLACISQRCVRTGNEGNQCKEDADCLGDFMCLNGVCSKPIPPGGECSQDKDICETKCNYQSKRCVKLILVPPLNQCGELGDETRLCMLTKSFCELVDPENLRFVCSLLLKEGEKCTLAQRCEDGLWCSPEGICKRIPKENEKCEGLCAEGLFCNKDGICQKLKEDGEVCLENKECRSGICVSNTCKPNKKMAGELCATADECYNLNCKGGICCSYEVIQKVQSNR